MLPGVEDSAAFPVLIGGVLVSTGVLGWSCASTGALTVPARPAVSPGRVRKRQLLSAAALIVILPVVIVSPIFQGSFVAGVTQGAIRG